MLIRGKLALAREKRAGRVIALCFVLLLFCLPAFSQLNLGRILGAITDQTGGVIAGATVTVTDVARGVSRPLIADGAGEYSAPSLTPGTYTVRAEAKGFKTVERQNILLEVGQEVRVDLTLQPGEQTQTITVTESLPMVNTTNTQMGGTIENQDLSDIPLESGEYQKLLEYKPGMQAAPGGHTPTYSSNGAAPTQNIWMFDGLEDTQPYATGGPIVNGNATFDQAVILPVDAIQEVNVIESPKAEYGWRTGGQVQVGLKSGTNSIHGSAYAWGRDTVFDAKNPFLGPSLPKEEDQLEQYGATIGGPIKKDKLFFFGGYEAKQFIIGDPRLIVVPSSVSGGGDGSSFPDAINAMNAAHEAPSQLSLNLAGCTAAGVCNPAAGIFNNAGVSTSKGIALNDTGGSNNMLAKIDYHLNDHNSINGEYYLGTGGTNVASAANQPYWISFSRDRAQVVRGVWIWTPNSNWVNEARFGYDRMDTPVYPQDCTSPNFTAEYGFASGLTPQAPQCGLSQTSGGGFPLLTITGYTQMGADASSQAVLDWTTAGSDSVSYTHGKHAFKFGGEVFRTGCACAGSLSNITGNLTFGGVAAFSGATALEDFLAGVPATGAVLSGNSTRTFELNRYAIYAQDDWRLTSRLTVNLGLRYEYESPITEKNDLLGNFDPSAPSGLVQVGKGVSQPYSSDAKNFAPRLGLAWDLTGKGTTVVRTSLNVIDDTAHLLNTLISIQGAYLNAIPTGFPLYAANGSIVPSPGTIDVGNLSLSSGQLPWAVNTPVFNTTGAALACGNGLGQVNAGLPTSTTNPANPAPCNIQSINMHYRTPYVTNWMLDVQHALTNNLSLDIGYVGNHGTDLLGLMDINQPTPGLANGKTSPTNENEQSRRPYYSQFPYLGKILYSTNSLESNYDALQASLTERISHGVSFSAVYTFDHALDDNASETSPTVMNSRAPNLDYGNDSNLPFQHLAFTGSYALPGEKSPGQMLEGWQLNTAIELVGGFPFNAADTASDLSGTGELQDRWTLAGPASGFKGAGGPGAVPCFGVSGSSFAKTANCITVNGLAFMPALCQTAAAAEATNPNVPNTGQASNATGTEALENFGCYFENGSAIVPPAQGTYGTMGRDVLFGRPFREWDLSVQKNWQFRERLQVQFRAACFNVLNSVEYAAPSSNPDAPSTFGQSQSTPNTSQPVVGNGGPRLFQFGLKFIF